MDIELLNLYQDAANCNSCFKKFRNISQNTVVKGGQPRLVGKNYFCQKTRVCLILINPGKAHTQSEGGWDKYLNPLKSSNTLEEKKIAWNNIQEFIEDEEPDWGTIKGNWIKLYYESLGIKRSDLSMVNIMMCAEDSNDYKIAPTLNECFSIEKKSLKIIQALKPNKVILSGGEAINFFCKKFSSLTALRKPRDNLIQKIISSRGEEGLKEMEFQRIPNSNIKDHIKKEFPNTSFYWIGHYAARTSTGDFDEAIKDAVFFSFNSNS